MATTDEPHSASLDAPTDPLMASQHLKDEYRSGDRPALYTALVRLSQLLIYTRTPDLFYRPLHW